MDYSSTPNFEQFFQMLTAIQREREALSNERQQMSFEVERMKIMFDKLSIQEQIQFLSKEKIEFYLDQRVKEADWQIKEQHHNLADERQKLSYDVEKMKAMFKELNIQKELQELRNEKLEFLLEQKVKEADLQFRQQSHAVDVKIFDASKKFEMMKLAIQEMQCEFIQLVQQKFGTLDKREIELQTKSNMQMQKEMQMQIQAKDQEMRNMVQSIANTNKESELKLLENQLNFRSEYRNKIVDYVRKNNFASIDDYMEKVWGFDHTRYLPRGH